MYLPPMLTIRCTARAIALALVAGAIACGEKPPPAEPPVAADGWREFQGTWTASGSRHTLHLGGGRQASVIDVSGSMLLAGTGRPGIGFRGDAIAFIDDVEGMVGRAVWTDERGDQVFSRITGERTDGGNRITGTFTGGTGRYAGAIGEYQFRWQYLIEAEEGVIQGRAVDLAGRVRRAEPAP